MKRALLLVLLIACKRESSSGLPPAKDWQGGQQPPATADMSQPPAGTPNPHTQAQPGPVDPNGPNPHAGQGQPGPVDPNGPNPHAAGMGGGNAATPTMTAPKTLDKLPNGKRALGPFEVAIPADWKEKPVTSSMRAADFDITADTEMIVYYFGTGGAGSVDMNVDRWVGQFTGADDKPIAKDAAKLEKTKVAGQDATQLVINGHYRSNDMMTGAAIDKPDAEMFVTIVESPQGPYFFRVVGPKKVVDANTDKIKSMLASMAVH